MRYLTTTLEELIFLQTQKTPETGCWLWVGAKDNNGYGRIGGRGFHYPQLAHRISMHVFQGFDLNSSFHVLHKCNNPACVNPEHLKLGTHADNMRDIHNNMTHCRKGHALVPENILMDAGRRRCRQCRQIQDRKKYQRKIAKSGGKIV